MNRKKYFVVMLLILATQNLLLFLPALAATDRYVYQYPYDNLNQLCWVTVSLDDAGNAQVQASSDCYPGGRLIVGVQGNFLASDQARANITVEDLTHHRTYHLPLGWGGSWGAEQTINLDPHASEQDPPIQIVLTVQKADGFHYQLRHQLGILDTFHPAAVIALPKEATAPIVLNPSALCSGKTVALYYDFLRMREQGANSGGSYLQFAPTVTFSLQFFDLQGKTVDTLQATAGWTFPDQYLFFRLSPRVKQLKMNFTAKNSLLMGGAQFFDPEQTADEDSYYLDCP